MMSADNGIYILKTLDGFRVIHAQAIDNLYWWDSEMRNEINPKELKRYFGNCKVYDTEKVAQEVAIQMYENIINDDYCSICEYGICYIKYNKPFPK